MATAQLLNAPSHCVDEALAGLLATQPGLARLRGHRVIVRRDLTRWRSSCPHPHRFSVMAGGGSGHEPAQAGLVGPGLLTAAVPGDVFASPPVSAILTALRTAAAPAGVLLIVANYTGDRLNFGLAAERARAEGVPVEMVVVGEDCALTGRDRSAGRRGLAGLLLIEKMAGACAEEGRRPLVEVAAVLRAVARQMATISVSLSACVKPGGGPSFELPPGSMEIGVGVHGEAGVGRVPAASADRTVTMMLEHMTSLSSPIRLQLAPRVVLLVNNLGGLSDSELHVVAAAATTELRARGSEVVRCRTGRLITSLAMAGVSLTVLNLTAPAGPDLQPGSVSADHLLGWLDAAASAPGWPFSATPHGLDQLPRSLAPPPPEAGPDDSEPPLDDRAARRLSRCVEFAARALLSCAGQMDRLEGGGGLYGGQVAALCRGVLAALPDLPAARPRPLLSALSRLCEAAGGAAGRQYALALAAAAVSPSPQTEEAAAAWLAALRRGGAALRRYDAAPAGQASLLDAVEPALAAAERALAAGQAGAAAAQVAAEAAEAAALGTADRSGTGRPAAAAHAVGVWTRAVAEALKLH